ncbi:MAG: nucleotide exchange factor GrpE [Actinomycetota bacterium]|nr:nucleotide exchange factor GrpE [Actinomycetota bacterium]
MNDHDKNEEARDQNPDSSAQAGVEAAAVEPTADWLELTLPDDPHEAQMILMRELLETRLEAGELLTNLHRVAAEFDNYRKRTERDQIDNIQRAGQRVIEALLPSLDGLDAALAIEAATETESRMLEGMRGTQSLMLDALARDGFAPIVAIGAPFDPALHEAVSVIPGEGEQVVQEELRKGYVMRGRLIRPSLVIVGHA